jgi:CheY-like chemotaxis protein
MKLSRVGTGLRCRIRNLGDNARPGAAEHAGAIASLCAFAFLGVPVFGVVVAALTALRRARIALAGSLARCHGLEAEVERLRAELREQARRLQTTRVEAAREMAESVQRERVRIAALAARVVCAPLRSLAALAEAPGATQPSLASISRSAVETLAQSIEDVFDPLPAGARAIVLDESTTDLRGLIDGVVALLSLSAGQKGVRLRVSIDRSVAAYVLADRARVGQIVFNLLSYVVESAGSGEITVAAQAEPLNGGAQRVFIGASETCTTARDQASGHTLRSVVDEVLQSEPDCLHHPRLALCRTLAHHMRGEITLVSGSGFGVCASFHAPFTIEERYGVAWSGASADAPQASDGHPDRARLARDAATAPREPRERRRMPRSILVVDDNEINRRVVARQIDVLGHRYLLAASAEEALAALSRQAFDLLITDLQMPGMSGVDLVARMRALTPAGEPGMPVVLITAHVDDAHTYAAAFDAVLVKPVKVKALAACLQRLPTWQPRASQEFDLGHIEGLAQRGVDVHALLRDWRESVDDDLVRLRDCRVRRDGDGLQTSLHRLCGAAGLVGAGALMEALQQASMAGLEVDAATLDELVGRIEALGVELDEVARTRLDAAAQGGGGVIEVADQPARP